MMTNPIRQIWNYLFPPQHKPQLGGYYRSTVFYHLTCRVIALTKHHATFELMRDEKTPFTLVDPIIDTTTIKDFNTLWLPFDE